ncbi:MAG: nucleotidyltransferase family protein [Solobacterium sp.]|nr:nucleotidyltransferase family protein [Solobacterium sp.]
MKISKGITIEKRLIQESLNERERKALHLLFSNQRSDEEILDVLEGLDPDTEDISFLLLLSMLGYSCAWKGFPERIIPRLKGIHRYYQVDNAMKFTWLCGILGGLEKAGIRAMLIKGGAMYVHYRQSSPRIMSDFDVSVPADRFEEACALVESYGCIKGDTAAWSAEYKAEIHGRTARLDLHCRMFKNGETADAGIRERAVQTEFRGMKLWIPSAEDMFIHLMDNQIRNLFHDEYRNRRTKWFFDCLSMINVCPDILDAGRLRKQADMFHNRNYIRLALRMFSAWFPEIVSAEAVEKCFPADDAYWAWLCDGMEYRKRYNAVAGFEQGGGLPPKRVYLSARRWIQEYRFMGPEFKEQFGKMSFVDFFCHQTGCRDAAEALKRYLPRLRLKG